MEPLPLSGFTASPSLATREGDDSLATGLPLLAVSSRGRALSRAFRPLLIGAVLCSTLSGCAVVAVTSTAVSVTAGAVGLAADAAIGTAKIVGKGVGKAADAMMDNGKPDNSGVNIRYREPVPGEALPSEVPATPATTTPITQPSSLQPNY